MRLRRLATVVGLLVFAVAILLSLTRCGDSSACFCPVGYVCVKAEKSWKCEPSPMPPTWASGNDGGVASKVSE